MAELPNKKVPNAGLKSCKLPIERVTNAGLKSCQIVDPSIASAAQGIGPNDLLNDLHTMGLLFETLVVRDLRVYAQLLDGDVLHYRDKSGLECDTVIHLRNGSYGLAEVKLGGERLIEEGAKNLKTLSDKIDTQKMNAPSFLMIIIGVGDYAYKRKDGVFIVPIGCLKP
ncbi:MAG: DUF4143 domain-containing protein [Intestinibaculum porci]|uniref:DUF4143 domain-containing protein n=1 Tax=Intestinibaculum porci TaxID=2487118 RepID=UPI003EFD629E